MHSGSSKANALLALCMSCLSAGSLAGLWGEGAGKTSKRGMEQCSQFKAHTPKRVQRNKDIAAILEEWPQKKSASEGGSENKIAVAGFLTWKD